MSYGQLFSKHPRGHQGFKTAIFSGKKKARRGIEEEPAERWLICLKELQEEMTAKITVSEQKHHHKKKR